MPMRIEKGMSMLDRALVDAMEARDARDASEAERA